MSPSNLYQWVLAGPSVEESVRSLDDSALCGLTGWLAQDYEENEQTGEVLGMCLVDQARRFTRQVNAREGKL